MLIFRPLFKGANSISPIKKGAGLAERLIRGLQHTKLAVLMRLPCMQKSSFVIPFKFVLFCILETQMITNN
jgi:hypothetical protein